jgi:hypothetical protein
MATGQLNDTVIGEIVDDIVSRGASDWVNLHELRWRVTEHASLHNIELSEDEKIDASIEVIRRVLSQGLMTAGSIPGRDDSGFRSWDLDPQRSAERIEREWRALHQPLQGPEICWLANTPVGTERGLAARAEVNRRFNWPPPAPPDAS